MRILSAGDLHGNKFLAQNLAEKAIKEKADIVILCGDLMEEDSLENVLKPFKDKNIKP